MKKLPLPMRKLCGNEKLICGKDGLVKLLRWHFGHAEFRGKQLDAIEAVVSGRDCFCLMPTGGGKSMCYQIPALAKSGIVLVVCPLIALMENQVMALKEKGIAAEYLSSTQTSHARNKIHEELESGKPCLRLLYVTPELIATQGFMSKLSKIHARGLLTLIAIDEAHCISSWGHDFRPSYRKLSSLRSLFQDVPILALTATAVPKVQKDVIESLSLRNPLILKSSFNRPNIYYEVRYKDLLDDTYADLSNFIRSCGDVCGIVYCLERTTCDDLSTHLSKNGISCAPYHAGLNNKLRSSVLDDWISSKIQVVVATVAFGCLVHGNITSNWCNYRMGIDRKDVRIVCHYNIPKSMEGFYQESGRAGRDQLPSRSLLYYGTDDRKKMVEFILRNSESKKLQSESSRTTESKKPLMDFNLMVEYCEGSGCRRKKVLESFGEQVPASLCKKSCDACKHPNLVAKYLEELRSACAVRQRNGFNRVFMRSSSDMIDAEPYSEFWNHDDEASGSEEDISDSDDGSEVVKSLPRSKLTSRARLNEKIELLQRAEESYYQNKIHDKQIGKAEKNAISEALREASKKRLLDALKQAQQRLVDLKIDLEASAALLENECYKKYGRTGKSFYYSQVASTVRWLSTTSETELTDRLGTSSCSTDNILSTKEDLSPLLPLSDNKRMEGMNEGSCETFRSEMSASPIQSASPNTSTRLPPIPSFSDFVNSKRAEHSSRLHASGKQSPKRVHKNPEKKMRLL